ncbi:alpha-galactosidase [Scopulibacillus darangshiensis]|uniref:Alpha-galactosidase n=1 Tax=Scopulibacillus darangshiensis TaxID=442528 RepID=A0A4R2P4A7_9BACL|nr:alpha-galactosidase [Scopulibacillus darangshiensis]TCP29477.1 alpha-galactosidase [Scopulibacillus darangshiensis]
MIKVAMIGAGSIEFTKRIVKDILSVPEFCDTEFRFMDVNHANLNSAAKFCRAIINRNGLPANIIETVNQKEAVKDADYVLCTIRVGGLTALEHDIEIPLKYGVDQCVGDTLGPGGIFYGLRMVPALLDLAKDMREAAPGALLINYANPMAINTWALRRAGGVRFIGLCHGVQGGHHLLAKALGIPKDELKITAAGINHQTWYIKASYRGQDMKPKILGALQKDKELAEREPCRIDVLQRFGYFSTESNGHLSEYLPWYRKRKDELDQWIYSKDWIGGVSAGYLKEYRKQAERFIQNFPDPNDADDRQLSISRSDEHASYIIEALETGRPYRGHFNVENKNMITNLPNRSTIEIPCYVDAGGIHPTFIGDLPLQCAATCRTSISVQEMAVEAALNGDRDLVKLAVLHDPLTAAVCNTNEVWRMCDEMLEALAPWLPQFNGEGLRWKDRPQPSDGLNYERPLAGVSAHS